MATHHDQATSKPPTISDGGSASRRVSNARIEQVIAQVDQEIDDQHDGGEQQHDVHDDDQVAVADRLEEQSTQAWQDEDVFDDDGADQQRGELDAEDGDHRDGGVPEAVATQGSQRVSPLARAVRMKSSRCTSTIAERT